DRGGSAHHAVRAQVPVLIAERRPCREEAGQATRTGVGDRALQPSLDLASFTIAIRAARTSSGVLTGLPNARRTGRGPSGVIADISKPYLSTPVMLAEVISVAFEKALQ